MESNKVIIFDCGGVLANDTPNYVFKAIAENYPPCSKEKISNIFKSNYDLWNKFKIDIQFIEDDYWNTVIEREDLKETKEELHAVFVDTIEGYPEVIKIAKCLKLSGYQIGILSNHSVVWFDAISKKIGLDVIFEKENVLISQAIRLAKPSNEIFEYLLSSFDGYNPQDILFFDDKQANVDAAKQLGISAFKFNVLTQPIEDMLDFLSQHGIQIDQ